MLERVEGFDARSDREPRSVKTGPNVFQQVADVILARKWRVVTGSMMGTPHRVFFNL